MYKYNNKQYGKKLEAIYFKSLLTMCDKIIL